MNNDYMKRGYLLPEGCKDLIDVLNPTLQHKSAQESRTTAPLPPLIGEMTVPNQTTVRELAEVLKQKPFRIIADLMEIGVFATPHQQIAFDIIAQVVRRYGYAAKKAV
ncbi:MAG: translation initiation factor IF-2 N-terminal domain-containing protein [Limisphaerales bacterium]